MAYNSLDISYRIPYDLSCCVLYMVHSRVFIMVSYLRTSGDKKIYIHSIRCDYIALAGYRFFNFD